MTEQPEIPPRLELNNISKSFGAVRVLDKVSISAAPGEIVALLGSNGAGKSTLMKILTGVYTRDTGDININGKRVHMSSPRAAAELGVSFLPQELSVFPDLSVAENICIADLGAGAVNMSTLHTRAAAALADLGFGHISTKTRVGDLTVAQQRIVEIARALAGRAEILVMDEPTASLSEKESAQIFKILERLKAKNTSVIYISHYLKEVFEIADRIVVLRDGRNAGDFAPSATDVPTVVSAMLGRVAGHLFGERQSVEADAPTLFSINGLSWKNRLDEVSMRIRAGEIVGVFGLIGSGVEVLGRVMFGAQGKGYSGEMSIGGESFRPKNPRDAKAAGMGFVTAERKTDGILADLSVSENLSAPFQSDFGNPIFVSQPNELENAHTWIDKLDIKTAGPHQPLRFLSGGNQQKVCVARWLNPKVRVLILEEPTRGVDVGARKDLYNHLVQFSREGLGLLVLSSDVEEIAGLCDRSFVIDRGKIVAEFPTGATASQLMAATAIAPARTTQNQ